jgi:hypothetical protein
VNPQQKAGTAVFQQVVGLVGSCPQGPPNQELEGKNRGHNEKSPDTVSPKLTRKPGAMTRKKKRRSSVVEIGNGPAKVKIYTMNRKDGYPEFTLTWREGGKRRARSFADMDEARMVAQQITVKIANGWVIGSEATKRDLELLWYCERQAAEFGVTLAAAIDEWVSARSVVKGIPLSDEDHRVPAKPHLATF